MQNSDTRAGTSPLKKQGLYTSTNGDELTQARSVHSSTVVLLALVLVSYYAAAASDLPM
jgi:hypothetical protein